MKEPQIRSSTLEKIERGDRQALIRLKNLLNLTAYETLSIHFIFFLNFIC